ncbi:uncharacterized protein [Lolium perenne]|uniref:uncharacterized protein n=1 Tax=Lolium perenne TaxID=4522 RepID=UPI0021F68B7C|nr:FCS-Like Zinc finger 6-like [Lolium perenne]
MACNNPMRRTTSLTEFAPPSVLAVVLEDEYEDEQVEAAVEQADGGQDWLAAFGAGGGGGGSSGAAVGPPSRDWIAAYRARAAPARAGLRRNSADYSKVETAAFLRHCGLCRRLLGPGRDTFMYKGEAAFCSLECRQQHITHEEWKDKCTTRSSAAPPTSRGGRRSSKTDNGGTVAAA